MLHTINKFIKKTYIEGLFMQVSSSLVHQTALNLPENGSSPRFHQLETKGLASEATITTPTATIDFDGSPVTKHLNRAQRALISERFCDKQALVSFVDKINSPHGIVEVANDIQKYKSYPSMGLQAFLAGLISEEQLATLSIFYAAIDQMLVAPARFELRHNYENATNYYLRLNIPSENIYLNGKDAKYDFKVHSIEHATPHERELIRQFLYIKEEYIDDLFAALKEAPCSEKIFYSFELPFGPVGAWSPLYHRLNAISSFFQPVNPFKDTYAGAYPPFKPQRLIVPSFSIFKIFFSLAFPDTHTQLQPFLGHIGTHDMTEYKRKRIRPINIGVPGIDVGEEADNFYGGKLIFTYHDFYHAIRDATTILPYQKALNKIDRILDKVIKASEDPAEIKELKKLKWLLTDGELFDFHKDDDDNATVSPFTDIFEKISWPKQALKAVTENMNRRPEQWKNYFA